MRIVEDKTFLDEPEYSFLDTNPHLGKNLSLVYLGGSLAYGLDTPESDIDIRGFAVPTVDDYLLMKDFQQIVIRDPDVTIYSANKFIHLLECANPNLIEVFDAPILQCNHVGHYILDNKRVFLSNLAINSFRGFANQQKKRLTHYSYMQVPDAEKMDDSIRRLGKYEANCIRCLRMGAELFSTGEVHTSREGIDKEELMDIKFGKLVRLRYYTSSSNAEFIKVEPASEFFDMFDVEKKKFESAVENSVLPERPNENKVTEIRKEISRWVLDCNS